MNVYWRLLAVILLSSSSAISTASGLTSRYLEVPTDTLVGIGLTPILTTTVQLPSAGWVYVQSDGRYFPAGKTAASAYITINGQKISNDSLIDWRQSKATQQHSFNVIGAKYLSAGTYTVSLVARADGGAAYFGATTNLSVLTYAATSVLNLSTAADTGQLNFDTSGTPEGTPLQASDRATLLTATVNGQGPIVALASGRSYVYGHYGDAMVGIFLNNAEPNIDSMTWSINDLYDYAETQAPMFSQALFSSPPSQSFVQFIASESPYYEPQDAQTNGVKFKVGANSRLITLRGGMQVTGKGLRPGFNYSSFGQNRRYAYTCIATNGHAPSCPPAGTNVVVGKGQVCVPAGHSGVVLFSAKTRVQGDINDGGGTVFFFLRIDGATKGSLGIQQLGPKPYAVSTRTISSSYLSAGNQRLSAGCHTVEAVARGVGDFRNLSVNADMPVMWFD